ncbi:MULTISPECIES: TadE/TadG family type IV pilus assembly protein [unclassified Phenylobacterium]|uniref:TadE/TadG family type IV pilus assembly protein n=1 Tax=unclassified Phenylobacterium TaxID=2640670 RepID=UPI000839F6C3|nr:MULTISPECIES: TadE/TadG family type IV pilus assembly protein [unclassified Phenylobacterium]
MFKIKAHAAPRRVFRRDESGAAAIEFALVAPLLFFTLLSLVELGVLGMLTVGLDNSMVQAARLIRTGQPTAATSAASFEDQICANVASVMGSCQERLVVSVQSFSAFSNAGAAASAPPAGQFNKGGPNDIILVKADYRWPLMSPFVATAFNRSGPLEVTISARTAFKNEPFE